MSESFDEQLEEILEQLGGNSEEFIERRINHKGFAKTIFFLCVKARTQDFIYAKELAEFRKITRQQANFILNDLSNIKMMKKNCKFDNFAEFWIVRDDFGVPKLNKYFGKCCKTLGIKNKMVVEEPEMKIKNDRIN